MTYFKVCLVIGGAFGGYDGNIYSEKDHVQMSVTG